jgi:hypothetical protein
MTTTTRKDIRATLAALLAANVPSAQAVYAYQVADFQGQSPVIALTSSGSERAPMTLRGARSTFWINAHVFVLYADAASGWTEEMAEDALDQVEGEIAAVVGNPDNARSVSWEAIFYNGRSNADQAAVIGGETYLHEVIPLQVEVFS